MTLNRKRMTWDQVVHYIAQGAVNITVGHTSIEPDSKIHQAMVDFCYYENKKVETKSRKGKKP